MSSTFSQYTTFVGIDVGKFRLAIHISEPAQSFEVDNTAHAITAVLDRLKQHKPLLICEASGGYENTVLETALATGLAIHRADARKVKAFIRSLGGLAKTDAIDAKALAQYGRERQDRLALWQAPDENRKHLQRLVMRRDELVAMRVAENNRRGAPTSEQRGRCLDTSFSTLIATLSELIKDIENAIHSLIADCQGLSTQLKTLTTIPGVGTITACNLLALMPELGTLTNKQAAALAGLAPHPRDSGNYKGYRNVRGGRPQVRRAVFMAALCASRSHTPLGEFVKRLKANGKKPIVAITALMRKIITIANAKIRDQIYAQQQS